MKKHPALPLWSIVAPIAGWLLLASIGLTIPAVAIVSLVTGWTLTLGIDIKSTVLLLLSLLVATLSLGTGRTTCGRAPCTWCFSRSTSSPPSFPEVFRLQCRRPGAPCIGEG